MSMVSPRDVDLEELLHLMRDRPAGQKMVRCSKVRAMFAIRACRKSVMIGMPLTQTQMITVCSVLNCVLFIINHFCSQPGYATYGDDGPALELSSRSSDYAPPHRPGRLERQSEGSPTHRLGFFISILLSICSGALV